MFARVASRISVCMIALSAGCTPDTSGPTYTVARFEQLFEAVGEPSVPISLDRAIAVGVDADLNIYCLRMAEPTAQHDQPRRLSKTSWDGRDSVVLTQADLDALAIEAASHLFVDDRYIVVTDLVSSRINFFDHHLKWICGQSLYDGFYARSLTRLDSGHYAVCGLKDPLSGWTNLHVYTGAQSPCAVELSTSSFSQPEEWRTPQIRPRTYLLFDFQDAMGAAVWNLGEQVYFTHLLNQVLIIDSVQIPGRRMANAVERDESVFLCLYMPATQEALLQCKTDSGTVTMLISSIARRCVRVESSGIAPLCRLVSGGPVCILREGGSLQLYRRVEQGQYAS